MARNRLPTRTLVPKLKKEKMISKVKPPKLDANENSNRPIKNENVPFKKNTKKASPMKTQSLIDSSKLRTTKVPLDTFLEQFKRIEQMRIENPAPVDTMGCAVLADPDAPPHQQRFQTLVALMLSSQTKDTITSVSMKNLKDRGLTLQNVLQWSIEEIEKMIFPVGFYKRKAVYLKKIAEILQEKDDIPSTLEEILKLPGIGPKMGHLIMTHAWNNCQGIGVDVHVHRISNRLEWVHTKTPEETRVGLEDWLPKEYWEPINGLLVGFGQTICAARPKCSKCLLSKDNLCPYYEKVVKNEEQIKQEKPLKRKREHLDVQ